MNPNEVKVLNTNELYSYFGKSGYTPIEIQRDYFKQMKTNLLTPSTNDIYSCAVEYITAWFLNKFPENFFKSRYIESTNIFHEQRSWKKKDFLSIPKPACSVTVRRDEQYDREKLDYYPFGANLYHNKASFRDAFFVDRDNSLYISLAPRMLLLNFTFRILVPEFGLQQDIADMCRLAFRANGTQKRYTDVDFHVPIELLTQLSDDTGHCVCPCSGKIADTVEFIHYFNMHSVLPLYYKLNTATQTMRFYLKMPKCLVHIRTGEVATDEGQRQGQLMNNFTIQFECQVRFPAPMFYAYYSIIARENIKCISKIDTNSFIVSTASLAGIPPKNDKGWPWVGQTIYDFEREQEKDILAGKLMKIKFDPIMTNFMDAIESTKSMAISPSVFLEIKVFAGYKIVKTEVNWTTMEISFLEPLPSGHVYIIIYMDNSYYHEQINGLKEYEKHRVQTSDTKIEHRRLEDYKKNLKRASMNRASDKVKT